MEHATCARPAIEEHRAARPCVEGCMDGGDQEVESQTPVREPGEVTEGFANCDTVIVRAVPDPDDNYGGEDVEGDETAQTC